MGTTPSLTPSNANLTLAAAYGTGTTGALDVRGNDQILLLVDPNPAGISSMNMRFVIDGTHVLMRFNSRPMQRALWIRFRSPEKGRTTNRRKVTEE